MIPCDVLRAMLSEARRRRAQQKINLFDVDNIPETGCWPAWIMDDMTHIGPSSLFTIELKPKWGFLLTSDDYKVHPVQTRICRNCIYQCLKHHQGRVQQISHYCPLDLFHNDSGRRQRALTNMLETPQNNFVVFDPDGVCLSDESQRPLANADLIGLVDAVLSEHVPLLARIQRSQRLTNLTLPRVHEILQGLTSDEWNEFVADPLSDEITQRLTRKAPFTPPSKLQDFPECLRDAETFAKTADGDAPPAPVRPNDVDDVMMVLRLILLEMTARDVSLMLTFTSGNEEVPPPSSSDGAPPIRCIEFAGRQWRYKIAVVDLETKYPKKIPHWIEVDTDMLAHFMELCAKSRS